MKRIFLGPWTHWLLLACMVVVLIVMGTQYIHVQRFGLFSLVLLILAAAVLGLVLIWFEPEQRVTREPFGEAELPH